MEAVEPFLEFVEQKRGRLQAEHFLQDGFAREGFACRLELTAKALPFGVPCENKIPKETELTVMDGFGNGKVTARELEILQWANGRPHGPIVGPSLDLLGGRNGVVEQSEQMRFTFASRSLQNERTRRARAVQRAERDLDVTRRVRDGENAVGGDLRCTSPVRLDEGNGSGGQMLPSKLAAQCQTKHRLIW